MMKKLNVSIALVLFLFACEAKLDISSKLFNKLNTSIESYKIEKKTFSNNENVFFFQELLPYVELDKFYDSNIKTKYVKFRLNSKITIVPIYILSDNMGKIIKIKTNDDKYLLLSDNSRFGFTDTIECEPIFKPEFVRNEDERMRNNGDYYFEQQLYFLKKDINIITNIIELYKKQFGHYPKTQGKYFLNYLLPFEDKNYFITSLPTDTVAITDEAIKIPIYKSPNAGGFFPYLSYNSDSLGNSYLLYYTGKNVMDELGKGDDIILN